MPVSWVECEGLPGKNDDADTATSVSEAFARVGAAQVTTREKQGPAGSRKFVTLVERVEKIKGNSLLLTFCPLITQRLNCSFSRHSQAAANGHGPATRLRNLLHVRDRDSRTAPQQAPECVTMPTLVWIRRPKNGTSAAAPDSARKAAAASTDPDQVVSAEAAAAAVPDPVHVAAPAISSKRCTNGGKKKKRKANQAESARAAKKKSKATSERDLPRGVTKTPAGKFKSRIRWGGKQRCIGTFDTPEQASTAFMSVRKYLDDAKLSAVGADEVDVMFDAAKKKLQETFVLKERDLPTGVRKLPSGKFESSIHWGGKKRYIGSFDAPEQASAAYVSVKKDIDDAKLSAFSADEVDAIFDAAKQKALDSFGRFVPEERDLPRGIYKSGPGKYESKIWYGGKQRYIGSFDTPEQASAALMSVKKDLDNAKLSSCGIA